MRIRHAFRITFIAALLLVAFSATAQVTTTKISWDIIGLDSNSPTTGPNTFMIGGRLCNTGATSIENVIGTFAWTDPTDTAYINLASSDQSTIALSEPIHPGECRDFYYNGQITNVDGTIFDSVANRTRQYSINWTYTLVGSSTLLNAPSVGGWLYAESLVSQNRNSVASITGPTALQVGGIYTFKVDWATSTNGYEQLQHFVNLTNTSFLLLESHSTYTAPSGSTNSTIYSNACGWVYDPDNPPDSPGACTSSGKSGGTVQTWFTVQILSPAANAQLRTLIYDYSGSSFHYNSDYGSPATSLTVNAEAAADLAVTLTPNKSLYTPGETITYNGTVCNNGPSAVASPGPTRFDVLIPSNTTFQSFTPPSGFTCSAPGVGTAGPATITCNRTTTFTPSTSCPTFTLGVQIPVGTTTGIQIQSNASVTSPAIDPVSSNNSAPSTVSVTRTDWADLAIDVQAPTAVLSGSTFNLTAVVTNNGPATSSDISINGTIPSGFTLNSAPAGWSCYTYGGSPAGWTVPISYPAAGSFNYQCRYTGTLSSGSTLTPMFSLTATAAAGTIGTFNGIVQSASVGEATYTNNNDTVKVSVVAPNTADLAITVTDSPDPVAVGETIQYTQTITNNGVVAANNPSITGTIPSNTTFTYIDPPAGWTCRLLNTSTGQYTAPLVSGSTGSYRCTYNGTLAPGASATIPLWVQTNTGTAGQTISYTASVSSITTMSSSATPDSVSSNNSATTTTLVAGGTAADLAITKTSSTSTGYTGQTVTYTIGVTNNGPGPATGVTVTDTVPASMSINKASSSLGTCSVSGQTVTCNIVTGAATMNVGQSAIVTIVVTPNTENFVGITNTASVSGTTTDPVSSNNSGSATIAVAAFGPTAVDRLSASAIRENGSVRVEWSSGFEVGNLGFNLYRETGATRALLNETPIAGSALIAGSATPLGAGFSYGWTDEQPSTGGVYWIESIGLDGERSTHGPIVPTGSSSVKSLRLASAQNALTLGEIHGPATSQVAPITTKMVTSAARPGDVVLSGQFELASSNAAKILVARDGLHRVTKSQLTAAGFDAGTNPDALRLFVNAEEVPIAVGDGGDKRFDASDYLEFHALGLDTMHSGTRTYWLVLANGNNGRRFLPKSKGSAAPSTATSFLHTLERKDRIIHIAALTSAEREDGFYGPLVYWIATNQAFDVRNIASTGGSSRLDLSLQGFSNTPHNVQVSLNGNPVGSVSFNGTALVRRSWTVPTAWLTEGTNNVTLLAGTGDVSLVDWVRLSYPHTFAADDDHLMFPTVGRTATTVTGFSSSDVRALDITDPYWPTEVDAVVTAGAAGYNVTVAPQEKGQRTIAITATSRLGAPSEIVMNVPSALSSTTNEADLVVITHPSFLDTIQPLVARRVSEGFRTIVASTEDVYDEFGFGTKSPQAIRDFLAYTAGNWRNAPEYVLLVGDASYDPRNFVGHGSKDLVPTKTVPTQYLMSVSDDWLVDFDDDTLPDMHLGRLSVATVAEARTVVAKLLSYGAISDRVLIVSDRDDAFSYEQAGRAVTTAVGGTRDTKHVLLSQTANQKSAFVNEVNTSPAIIDFIGHASVNVMGRNSFFGNNDVPLLTNEPSVFVMMNCFNTLYQGSLLSLGEALLRAPDAGAVAVWGSSAMTLPWPQNALHVTFYRTLATNPRLTLGELSTIAKAGTEDPDVRRTWILLGDPTMRLQP